MHQLPALPCFTGEGADVVDDGFDRWTERFCKRAQYAGWTPDEQLYQLKLHLAKTALDVFWMLPDSDSRNVKSALTALKKHFKPADIEELRGLEFHHRTQGDESIEQLGISIQQLGRKAFPTIVGKDFDRLLKGRFYQALLVKWQRKLGSPKPDESFHDLMAHARMMEEYEKQFAASAEARAGTHPKKPSVDRIKRGVLNKSKDDSTKPSKEREKLATESEVVRSRERRCYQCKEWATFAVIVP